MHAGDAGDSHDGWAIVMPVKPAATAKSRLASLGAPQRTALATAFARDALAAVLASALVDRIVVVGDVLPGLDDHRVLWLPESKKGLSHAIDTGLDALETDHPVAVLVSDIPAVRTHEISAALAEGRRHRLSLVCDREGTGTTMLLGSHREEIEHRFGLRSRAAHVRLGAVDLMDLRVPGLRCDVDTEVDLWDACRLGVGSHTRALLDGEVTRRLA